MAGATGKEQNFWPGFVDALTNMVLVMVFIVLVLSVTMASAMMKLSKMQIEKVVQEHTKVQGALRKEIDELRKENASLKETKDSSICLSDKLIATGDSVGIADESTHTKDVELYVVNDRKLKVSYNLGHVTFDDSISIALNKIVTHWKFKMIKINASHSEPSPSEGRRLSFYRAMKLRDLLILAGFKSENIKVSIDDFGEKNERSIVFIEGVQ